MSPTGPATAAGVTTVRRFTELNHELADADYIRGRVTAIEAEQKARILAALPEALESLAAIEHEQWMAWAQTLIQTEQLSKERVGRWTDLMVPYDTLSEEEKEHDRKWARLSAAALAAAIERVLGDGHGESHTPSPQEAT